MMADVHSTASENLGWLRDRWSRRFPELPAVGAAVLERYAEPHRIYHDARHLEEVLRHLDALVEGCRDREAVELAAWFHDAVYDVQRPDNEVASAQLARTLLSPYLPPDQVDEVARLVRVTRDHEVEAFDANGAVLCDADLAVLSGDPADYADYTRRVREEYASVPDDVFRAGRAEVLRRLLVLPRLFHTAHGMAHWEAPARTNLRAELTSLTTP